MKTFSMTHIGQRREMNQDYMFTSETAVGNLPNLFLVADGMGGHAAGDYASRFTVEKLVELIGKSGEKEPVAIMKSAVSMTNSLLLTEAQADPAKNWNGYNDRCCNGDREYTLCRKCWRQQAVCDQSGRYYTDYKGSFSG